ncbi:MAG: hypothetical protein RSB32_06190 [Mucinivorans sp.]
MEGWIKIHRAILDWEWFDKPEMIKFFIYCLCKANFEDRKWRGIEIKRGQFLTSLDNLSKETKLSTQAVRTCIARLKSTQELTHQSTNTYTIITVCNYDNYQQSENEINTPINTPINKQLTNEQQTNNKRTTTTKELKNIRTKELKKEYTKTSLSLPDAPALAVERERGFFNFLEIFFFKGFANPVAETEKFIAHYEGVGWLDAHGRKIQNKLSIAKNWEQKKPPATSCGPLPRIFIDVWKIVFERLKLIDPQNAGIALNIISAAVSATTVTVLVDTKTEPYFVAQRKEIITTWKLSTKLKFCLQVKTPNNETPTNPAATP